MEKFLLFLAILLTITGCNTTTQNKYTTYNGIPCSFNGVKIGDRNDNAQLGNTSGGCVVNKPYPGKRGQSFHVKRGTPIVAPTDLKLRFIVNYSAEKNCVWQDKSAKKHIKKHGCMVPYDALKLELEDYKGNVFLFYHLMDKSPFVPGFGKGKCAPTETYRAGSVMGYPSSCGGIVMDKVSKGDVIGYSGTTGKTEHFSFAVRIENHPSFPNQKGWIIPSNELVWENFPSKDRDIYLLPVQAN